MTVPTSIFPRRSREVRSGFTMIEIALCLAIIGFGLVAIIGVLPTGLNVQKDNREETIIGHDAVVWMNTIRSGSAGFQDLTNYVIAITNYWTRYPNTNSDPIPGAFGNDGYTGPAAIAFGRNLGSAVTSTNPGAYPLISGARIIGLLSTPKFLPPEAPWIGGPYQSNYIVAYVRAMSGIAIDKVPQDDPVTVEGSFVYRMIVDNTPLAVDHTITNADYQAQIANFDRNMHEVRLFFRWPVLPNGEAGNGRETFRLTVGGGVLRTDDSVDPNLAVHEPNQPLYFLQPSTYVQAR